MQAAEAAAIMLGSDAGVLGSVVAGGNSRIHRVDFRGQCYALKEYPPEHDDPRRRRDTEREALRFLERQGMTRIPRFIAAHGRYSMLSWIEGSVDAQPDTGAILQAAAILQQLQSYSTARPAQAFGGAFEACASLDAFAEQLRLRMHLLEDAAVSRPELATFLTSELAPAFQKSLASAYDAYNLHAISAGAGREHLRLIHGDFGLHNLLKDRDGQLHLIDFEYFGWDDPVKMIADFVLHPGTPLDAGHRAVFLTEMARAFSTDKKMTYRLEALLPLFAVRWACISLNCFLPARRPLALPEAEFAALRKRQIAQASALVGMPPNGAAKEQNVR